MAKIKFSEAQQTAISARHKDILVSAAAGSGKTAVLVQRIIDKITDTENPVDVDALLVVTFTHAAAGEMKGRIGRAIQDEIQTAVSRNDKKRAAYLQRQYVLLYKSYITTIDSFCNNVVRQNFHLTDLDPEYRIADEKELSILRDAAMEEILEKKYDEYNDEFKALAENCVQKIRDEQLEKLIWSTYKFSRSMPYPTKWLDESAEKFNPQNNKNIWETDWGKLAAEDIEENLLYAQNIAHNMRNVYDESGEFSGIYEKLVTESCRLADELADNFKEKGVSSAISKFNDGLSFVRLAKIKKTDTISQYTITVLKGLNDEFKSVLKGISEKYTGIESMYDDAMADTLYSVAKGLSETVKEFDALYSQKKLDKQLVDFNDVEHICLNILADKDGNPTAAAEQYRNMFEEIIIDEYQDSSLLQESILTAVSKKCEGKKNIFMVGDVKQCIYKFRLANPELFTEKYNSYSTDKSADDLLINLSGNYRSRACVLEACNFFFRQLMSEKLGGVDYGDAEALIPNAVFPDPPAGVSISRSSEMYIIDNQKKESENAFDDDINEINSLELEAKTAAKRIIEMTSDNPMCVFDAALDKYRTAKLSDIAVLLRSPSASAGVVAEVFSRYGINTAASGSGSMFDTIEIQTVCSVLRLIDNPVRDIDLIAVLHSPMYGLSCDDLAEIRMASAEDGFYFAAKAYASNDNRIAETVKKFFDDMEYYRDTAEYDLVSNIVQIVYDRSGYGTYVSALSGGALRSANLRIFRELALKYEANGSYTLSGFLRYLEALETNGGVKAAANTKGAENAVKIMSIHKSKGLEFPIVFVMQTGKKFNFEDTQKNMLLHQQYGYGPTYVDVNLRVKTDSMAKKIMRQKMISEILSEEMRLLYVAFTRAKEKLIITGSCGSPSERLLKYEPMVLSEEKRFGNVFLSRTSNPLDWLLPAVIRRREYIDEHFCKSKFVFDDSNLDVHILSREQAADESFLAAARGMSLFNDNAEEERHIVIDSKLTSMLEYKYDRIAAYGVPSSISITEIKKRSMIDEPQEKTIIPQSDEEESAEIEFEPPVFIKPKEIDVTGAQRGTAYHKAFEQLDFRQTYDIDGVKAVLDNMVRLNMITAEEREKIEEKKLLAFLNSDIGERLRSCRDIFCETPFAMLMPAERALNDESLAGSNAKMLVRGIIDLFFEEDDGIVLIDYKTDKSRSRSYYIKNYRVQLDLYKEALEKSTGINVKEVYIYAVNVNGGFISL